MNILQSARARRANWVQVFLVLGVSTLLSAGCVETRNVRLAYAVEPPPLTGLKAIAFWPQQLRDTRQDEKDSQGLVEAGCAVRGTKERTNHWKSVACGQTATKLRHALRTRGLDIELKDLAYLEQIVTNRDIDWTNRSEKLPTLQEIAAKGRVQAFIFTNVRADCRHERDATMYSYGVPQYTYGITLKVELSLIDAQTGKQIAYAETDAHPECRWTREGVWGFRDFVPYLREIERALNPDTGAVPDFTQWDDSLQAYVDRCVTTFVSRISPSDVDEYVTVKLPADEPSRNILNGLSTAQWKAAFVQVDHLIQSKEADHRYHFVAGLCSEMTGDPKRAWSEYQAAFAAVSSKDDDDDDKLTYRRAMTRIEPLLDSLVKVHYTDHLVGAVQAQDVR